MNKKNINLKKMASIASILTAVFLTLIKVFAGILTGSLAVISSMIENVSDIFASIITFVAVRYSSMPPSKTHRYGYGKIEAISALIQACFIIGSAVFIINEAIKKFFMKEYLTATAVGVLVMIVSLIATLLLVSFQVYVYKKTKSQAIKADSAHYKIDIASNIAIIISLGVDYVYNIYWIDPLTAVIVALYLIFSAYDILKDAINMLLDKELDIKIIAQVKRIILNESFVKGIHDLRTRDLGNGYLFEFHLELDGDISLNKAHEYTDIIEEKLKNKFDNSQIVIHQEPHGINDERLDDEIKKRRKKTF